MSLSLSSFSLPPTPRALFDILKLEAGPAALPASTRTLWISLIAYGLSGAAGQALTHDELPALAYGLVDTVLLAATTAAVLRLNGASERFGQTLTALTATGAIVALVSVVLSAGVALVFPAPLPTGKLVGFVLFPLVIWKITLYLWIFRHASLRFIPALAVAASYVGLTLFVLSPLLVRIFDLL